MAYINRNYANAHRASFLDLAKTRNFCIHGGGNIGLGCMADIVSKSSFNYHITATSRDKLLMALINSTHSYWLQHGTDVTNETTQIKNVKMVDANNKNNIIDLYCQADLMAMCLTEKALLNVVPSIAQGLLSRHLKNRGWLKILILMNRPDANKFVFNEVKKALFLLLNDAELIKKILDKIEFVPTVVDRIVSRMDRKNILLQLKNQLNQLNPEQLHKVLDVHDLKKSFSEQIEMILLNHEKLAKAVRVFNLKFNLFCAELDFSLYVPDYFREALHFNAIKSVENLNQFADVKNKFINGPHSILAWVGGLMGFKTISEAIHHPSLQCFINDLMEREIAPILKVEYPEVSDKRLKTLKSLFINRCKASTKDPILRVGRDPIRKLKGGVGGLIKLKQKHNLKFATPELERGIAAGIVYAVKKVDPQNEECQKMNDIYRRYGSYKEILSRKDSQASESGPLNLNLDYPQVNKVLAKISIFEKIYKIRR